MTTDNRPPSVYLDDVFEAVLALPPEQREAAIQARCAGHPSLASDVRALIAAEEQSSPSDLPRVHVGAELGRWQLVECLGEGASASVWKAWDTHLRAWTALKLIKAEFSARTNALQTVLTEARAASAIISDHVVRIRGAGKIPEGPYYVDMELCAEYAATDRGEALSIGVSLADDPPRGPQESARLVMEAARGCDAAHRVGVLHRDIKPANILVSPYSRRALVADFGLSTAQLYPTPKPGTPSTATVTLHLEDVRGPLVGTPSFMPPEQAWGEPAARTNDVYALGATLYALLAERAPYHPPSADRPLPALEVVHQVREGPPIPIAQHAPHVPARLRRIVERAMDRDPGCRYPTCAALAEDLEAFLADRPASVDRGRPWLSVGLFTLRHRAIVSAGAAMLGMLLVFIGAVTALELRRSALLVAVEEAESQRSAAQIAAEEATLVRQRAEKARDQALGDRKRALAAKDRAQRSQNAAEALAAQEVEARMLAENDRLEALQKQIEAEAELDRASEMRLSLEEALLLAQSDYTEQRAKREWLEVLLEDEAAARLTAEANLKASQQQLDVLREQLADALAQQALAEAAQAAEVNETDATSTPTGDAETAPWMDEPSPAPTAVTAP